MAQRNTKVVGPKVTTHEGGPASRIDAAEQLRRSVMATMLWENGFYEDGEAISERIVRLTKEVSLSLAQTIMYEAKFEQKLRHVPLLMAVALVEDGRILKEHVEKVVTRADELAEILSLYWRNGKKPLPHQLRKGLALAFAKFDEYQLAKYNRQKEVKLRDVLRLVRPKPTNPEQSDLWKRLIKNELATPDTWEVELSAGKDKAETFGRLLDEGKLGDLALLRNLRNMIEAKVPLDKIKANMAQRQWSKMLPFQFITAARYAPILEPEIEQAMLECMVGMDQLTGRVAILVDGSGSMAAALSDKSELTRFDAACGLAILTRAVCQDVTVFRFNDSAQLVPARKGFALRDALGRAEGGTAMWKAVAQANQHGLFDLVMVITDEQTSDARSALTTMSTLAIINIANSERGVGYGKNTINISGWSENVVRYLVEYQKELDQ